MKKASVLFVALALSLSLGACSSSTSKTTSSSSKESTSKKVSKASKLSVAKEDVEVLFTDSSMKQLDKETEKSSITAVDKEVKKLPPSTEKSKLSKDVEKAKQQFNRRVTNQEQHLELNDGTKVTVTKVNWYKPNSASTWNGTLKITEIDVAKTNPFSYDDGDGDTTCEGMIQVHYSYNATADVTLFDDQAVLSTSDGQQADVDSDDSRDIGDINSGVTKKGVSVFFFQKSNIDKVTSIRLKADAAPQDINSDDTHTFDITVPLEK